VAGGGGRREGEKTGRSRVIDNCLSGSAQSGFPADGGRSTAASGDRAAVRSGPASTELTAPSDGGAVAELTGRSGGAVVCAYRDIGRGAQHCDGGEQRIFAAQIHFDPCHCPETEMTTRNFPSGVAPGDAGPWATS